MKEEGSKKKRRNLNTRTGKEKKSNITKKGPASGFRNNLIKVLEMEDKGGNFSKKQKSTIIKEKFPKNFTSRGQWGHVSSSTFGNKQHQKNLRKPKTAKEGKKQGFGN